MEDATKIAYGRAIDILMSGGADYKAICLKLAKEAPEAFIALHDGAPPSPEDKLRTQMIEFIKANPGKKVEAIKTYRNETGLGLKESKDYVDALTVEIQGGLIDTLLRGHVPVAASLDLTGISNVGFPSLRPTPNYRDGGSF